jgi:hypothetical protein
MLSGVDCPQLSRKGSLGLEETLDSVGSTRFSRSKGLTSHLGGATRGLAPISNLKPKALLTLLLQFLS